ncbi:type II toxin-antitoxin system HicA family toxin, partial [Acinetobacter sp.]|uniref:type II toxin-antitoxin system HicA family toxin n=1 Tax=Acinetobacter sp. TaxID=472 RepID=UPI003981CE1A
MGAGFYDKVIEILLLYGCNFERQGKGSHEIWYSPITDRKFPVAVTIESRHTANGIFKQAGIDEIYLVLDRKSTR